jgi:hypothetical protein
MSSAVPPRKSRRVILSGISAACNGHAFARKSRPRNNRDAYLAMQSGFACGRRSLSVTLHCKVNTAAAPPRRLHHPLRDARFGGSTQVVISTCLAALVVVVGVLGLAVDSVPRRMVESWINIHALFALLLCGVVIAEYRRRAGNSGGLEPDHGRALCRELSRIVYLSLYVVIGVRQCVALANAIWHGGAVDFNLLNPRFRAGPDSGAFDPQDDFQMFLASGLFALILVRGLAFRSWLRVSAMRNR